MTVTPLYAGLLGLWFLVLTFRVIRGRRAGIALGDGGDPLMLRAIRGHGNFAEYVPLVLVMMVMLEMSRFSIYVIHTLGILLLVGRVLHGYALSFTEKFMFGRMWGTILTLLSLLIAGVLCIYQSVQGHSVWLAGAGAT